MIVCCDRCAKHYDDAECWTVCPHNPLMSKENMDQKKLAISLLGKEVRFAHDENNPTWYRIQSMGWNGMLTLEGMAGEFAPHLFVAAENIVWK